MVKLKAILILFLLFTGNAICQKKRFLKDPHFIITPSTAISLEKELMVFNDGNTKAEYRLMVAADVPNNKKPNKLLYQMESGHVFLVLQKINNSKHDTIHKVFGFYPDCKGFKVFFKKEVKALIKDNSKREHDIELSKSITELEFTAVMKLAVEYSKRRYHLNHFNCYDYALEIFNTVTGADRLPIIHTRFFIFGKGGSPCTFYKYMLQQKQHNQAWSSNIQFGNFMAPSSTTYQEQLSRTKQ